MAKVFTAVDQLIGGTPLLELSHIEKELGLKAKILAKLEYLNPAGSAKDRVGKAMIDDAEERGLLKPGGRFCIVHRLERLPLLLGTMYLKKLFPSRLRYVRHRQGRPVKLVLLEGVKDCETEMLRLPDLILCHLDGTYTQETKRIYRMEETI